MKKIGYMRISTEKQDHALQRDAMTKAGVDAVYEDTISGSVATRTGLDACLAELDRGDTLVVWKLDRLGRKAGRLHDLIDGFLARGINFVSLTESLDTTTPCGRAMFGVMASFAQMEREVIQERVRAGLDAARAKGKKLGRKFKYQNENVEKVEELSRAGLSQKEITKATGISQSTVSRILARTGEE